MQLNGVTETATQWLREQIITGKLPAGSRINEIELAERIGISRPPLREALRRLENESLVKSVPRKGCFVAQMSLEDCEQVYRARLMLECTAIDIAGRERDVSFEPVRRALEDAAVRVCEPSRDNGGMIHCFYAMADFHLQLVECACNRWLTHCYLGLQSNLARYQVLYLNIPGSRAPSLTEHGVILSHLEGGQYEEAKALLVEHIGRTREQLVESIRNAESAPGKENT